MLGLFLFMIEIPQHVIKFVTSIQLQTVAISPWRRWLDAHLFLQVCHRSC